MISYGISYSYFNVGNIAGELNSQSRTAFLMLNTLADAVLYFVLAIISMGWTIIERSLPVREKMVFVVISCFYILFGGLELSPDSFIAGFGAVFLEFITHSFNV